MGLDFGWKPRDVRESIWKGDDSLWADREVQDVDDHGEPKVDAEGKPVMVLKKVCLAPAAALEAWKADGDATHLRPYCTNGKPQIITFRNLTLDETFFVESKHLGAANMLDGWLRAAVLAFRIAVDFEGKETQGDPSGTGHKFPIVVKERGVRMLAEEFVIALEEKYTGIVAFYGRLIMDGSTVTEAEKKASSPPSTQTPSEGAASTVATTDEPPKDPDA